MIPEGLKTIGGTWGAIHDAGDLTYLNLIHLQNLTALIHQILQNGEIEGRRQAMMAIEALKSFNPGCEKAKLRNFWYDPWDTGHKENRCGLQHDS